MSYVVICDAAAMGASASSFGVGEDFIVAIAFGVARDNVPCVDKPRDVAEHAEEDVN